MRSQFKIECKTISAYFYRVLTRQYLDIVVVELKDNIHIVDVQVCSTVDEYIIELIMLNIDYE